MATCEASGCHSTAARRVRTKRGDSLDVCAGHLRALEEAGEVAELGMTYIEAKEVRDRVASRREQEAADAENRRLARVEAARREFEARAAQPLRKEPDPVAIEAAKAHSERIKAGIELARANGVHVGRRADPVPAETLATAEAIMDEGGGLRVAAEAVGLSKDTLRRRLAEARDNGGASVAPPAREPLLDVAERVKQAAGLRTRAAWKRKEAEALEERAEALLKEARAVLGGGSEGVSS